MKSVEERMKKINNDAKQRVNEKEYFNEIYEKMEIPNDIPKLLIELEEDKLSDIISLLVERNFVTSNSEFERLIKQGEVCINNESISDTDIVLVCKDVIRIGKRTFVEIVK